MRPRHQVPQVHVYSVVTLRVANLVSSKDSVESSKLSFLKASKEIRALIHEPGSIQTWQPFFFSRFLT